MPKKLPYMLKHKGFPGRLPGTDMQFVIRRPAPTATKLEVRERKRDRNPKLKQADVAFLSCLWTYFGDEDFERGNLDAGRLSMLFGREVVPVDPDNFDPEDYEAMLRLDVEAAEKSFPEVFDPESYKDD